MKGRVYFVYTGGEMIVSEQIIGPSLPKHAGMGYVGIFQLVPC